MYFYNEQINKRFNEFNLIDWAYQTNSDDPLSVPSRFGEEENSVNLTYK
jgi:hypothetical protein